MEKHSYEQYVGKEKNERRELMSASGALDRRRFLLSRSLEWKERIKKLQEVFYEIKKDHPEVVSLSLFGSLTKGYANEESDVDGWLNIDNDKTPKNSSPEQYQNMIISHIKHALNLDYKKIEHVVPVFWQKEEIIHMCKHKDVGDLVKLFTLSIGRDINNYRKIVFDELEKEGLDGEIVWISLMDKLALFESGGLDGAAQRKRRKLYPRNLAEGRKYFLQGLPDEIS